MKKVFRRLFIHLGEGAAICPVKAYFKLKVKGVDFTQRNLKILNLFLSFANALW